MDAGQRNYITLLNELSQKCSWTVEYQEVNKHGPEHTKIFTIRAVVTTCSGEKTTYAEGSGLNKREAKQFAAKNAYDCLKKEELLNSATTSSSPDKVESFAKFNQPNYTCWLNEYAQKNKLVFKAIETTKMSSDMNVQFCIYACQYVCDEKEFSQALGKGKKEAKETAAKLVYEELIKKHETEVLNEHSKGEQSSNMSHLGSALRHLKLSSHEHSTTDQNFIGILNQHCQTAKLVHDFKLIEKRGPAHKPEFVYKVVINKRAFPEGRGKTVKEAKQNAAQAWYEKNRESSDQSSRPENYSLSQNSDIEPDDQSTSNSISKNQNTSESIIFRDTSADKPDIISPVSQQCPLNVRAKCKLAANFQFSPNRSKEEAPYMNVQHVTKPTKENSVINQSTKSRFLEEFNSIKRIGKGGFGRVFKAKGNLERLYYAVKIVKYTDKACREVEGLANLDHTNIVRYHTSWIEDTAYNDEGSDSSSTSNSGSGTALKFLYIQMEFCKGETLCAWIERNSQPKQNANRRQEAAQIMKQVLEAVKYVHSKSLIHRDLKPANIMIGHERRVKVVDFGLVTTADADNDGRPLERTKKTGTRSYMSPEQMNHSNYDRKVDIFALGLIYFELLWNFGTCAEKQKVWENVRHKNLPKTFDEKFEFEYKLILQMLSINPEERPDAIKLFSQLDQYIIDDHNAQRESRTY